MKTYDEWSGNLEKYLNVGDEVDQEMADYFRDVLPPIMHRGFIQISEPYSHLNDGRSVFATIRGKGNKWYYLGHLPDVRRLDSAELDDVLNILLDN